MKPKELAAAKRLFEAGRIVSFNEGREAGIKEVVEWIADICGSDTFMATDGKRMIISQYCLKPIKPNSRSGE